MSTFQRKRSLGFFLFFSDDETLEAIIPLGRGWECFAPWSNLKSKYKVGVRV